jgi:hypothetical protein
MPADFSIDAQRRMVFSNATGVLTLSDALDHMDRLSRHPDFRPAYNQLFDFRKVTEIALSGDDIQEIAARNIFAPGSRRAFLVATGLQFGMARMFATYRRFGGEQGISVFTDANKARSWVSLPDEA